MSVQQSVDAQSANRGPVAALGETQRSEGEKGLGLTPDSLSEVFACSACFSQEKVTKPFLALVQSTGEGAHRSSLGKQEQSNRANTRAADKPPVLLSLPHQE